MCKTTKSADGKGKGWMAVGLMSLKGLSFLASPGHPLLALLTESSTISTRRAPSAYPAAAQSPPLLVLLQYDNYMP
jgi:hypothetical protein